MNIEEMKKRKKELGYSNKRLSEASGVPVGTIQKIFSGETSSPRYDTIMALSEALSPSDIMMIHEPEPAYNIPEVCFDLIEGEGKTVEDYEALPEGTRIELIDGQFYDMAAPSILHQDISAEIVSILRDHVRKNGGKCKPYASPIDVQLVKNEKTILQPDVIIVCDRDKITKKRIIGAPDLVIEIVSPNYAARDVLIKFLKYKDAGVKEYWIIFPEEKKIMVYDFTRSDLPIEYSFKDSVPVGIWNGECTINFMEIYEQIAFMYHLEEEAEGSE